MQGCRHQNLVLTETVVSLSVVELCVCPALTEEDLLTAGCCIFLFFFLMLSQNWMFCLNLRAIVSLT